MNGKKIILGVTGSIAAYKTAALVRLLVKAGAEVQVIMTPSAQDFITPLTLSVLSKQPVLTAYVDKEKGTWNNHVDLGCWADLLVIAPLSASTLSKMATGACDNLLMAVYLSARCPVMVAPAMDLDMWKHASTQENLQRISNHGVRIIPPASGELASGLSGEGRMEEPEKIFESIGRFFDDGRSLSGLQVLVTAGPTFEPIDPVRFIGNRSTGKMGFALASELADRGASVTLVAGPSSQAVANPRIHRVDVQTAAEMHAACLQIFSSCHLAILSAAVADFKPKQVADKKLKKDAGGLSIEWEPTVDILADLGKRKTQEQVLVGFALETDNELDNARKKLEKKSLDHIVLNSLRDEGAGFAHDTNRVTILAKEGGVTETGLKSKKEVAREIVDVVTTVFKK
ncbi:MAG: bifunctional phosphopantothenoylcysteine decarboxylase/phosphopantothenate--cysteine ligase CoaBC [Bacteroidota bacterium]